MRQSAVLEKDAVTGSSGQEALASSLIRSRNATSTLVPRKRQRYKSGNTSIAKKTLHDGSRPRWLRTEWTQCIVRQNRTVKRAPKHESKVQQVFCWKLPWGRREGRDIILTNTTRGHIGGHHDGAFGGLKLVEDPVTLVLLLITVDGCCGC